MVWVMITGCWVNIFPGTITGVRPTLNMKAFRIRRLKAGDPVTVTYQEEHSPGDGIGHLTVECVGDPARDAGECVSIPAKRHGVPNRPFVVFGV